MKLKIVAEKEINNIADLGLFIDSILRQISNHLKEEKKIKCHDFLRILFFTALRHLHHNMQEGQETVENMSKFVSMCMTSFFVAIKATKNKTGQDIKCDDEKGDKMLKACADKINGILPDLEKNDDEEDDMLAKLKKKMEEE